MSARGIFFVLVPLLACRPDAPPSTPDAPPPPTPVVQDDAPLPPILIEAGRGVVVRPGATVWLDAEGTRPLVLPTELPRGGLAMRVIVDRGALLELEVDTASACSGLVLDDFALRVFVAREWLREVTSKAFEHRLEDKRLLIVHAGAPVEGAAGARTVVVGGEIAPISVVETNVARNILVEEASYCMELIAGGASTEVPFDPKWASVLAPVAASDTVSAVGSDARVYWDDGTPAGKVAHQHSFVGAPKRAGERTCFAVPLADKAAVTLCFDKADVREGLPAGAVTGLIGGKKGASEEPAKVPGRVVVGTPSVKGEMDADLVRKIVQSHSNELNGCYRRLLAEEPTAAGELTMRFELAGDGAVRDAKVLKSQVKNAALGECFTKALGRWKFPKLDGGGQRVVTVPFELASE